MIANTPEPRGTFSARSNTPVRAVIFMAFLLLLSACDQQNETGRVTVEGAETNASFTPPTQLLSTRSIVRDNLVLEITIDDDTTVVEPDADGIYEFETTRPVNSSSTVTIVWSELIDGELLPLARATKRLDVGSASSALVLPFASTEFDTTSDDADEDGFSNFIERRDGVEGAFNDPDSPVSPPVIVTVQVQLALPVGMSEATAERRAGVTAKALVNSETILLSREGDVWTGSTTVTENTEPLVTATFYALADEETEIAALARSQNIGSGGLIVFNEDDYDVEFNDDGDDFNNIQETAIGSNPRDSSDPRAPVANAGVDTSITSGGTVTLNGSASSSDSNGSISTYRWTEGTSDLGTGVSLVVSGLGIGVHEIELRVTDNLGLTDTDTVEVTVTAAPVPNQVPVASAGVDQTIESGASVTLSAGDSSDPDGTIASYQWSEGGVSRGTGETLVLSSLSDGQHVITLLVTDDDGETDTDTVTVTVNAAPAENELPVADAGANQTVDSGDSVTLDGSDSTDTDGTINSYRWSENSMTLGTGVTLVLNNLSDGTHTISLEVTDSDGAMDTDTVTITVNAAVVDNELPVADAGANRTIESGESVTLNGSGSSDSDGTITSYSWSENSMTLGTGVTLVLDDLSDGTHTISLEVTDSDDASDTDTVTITVTAAEIENELPVADAGEGQVIDSGDSVTLDGSGSSDSDGNITTYEWFENSESLGSGVTLVVPDLSEGPHAITLEVTDNDGDSDTDTVTIQVSEAPPVANEDPIADAGADQTVNSGDPVTLDGSGSSDLEGPIQTYRWLENSTQLGTGETLLLNNFSDGEHGITLQVTDANGATDTDEVTITVTPDPEPPEADAGPDQTIDSGDSAMLDGSGSTDGDGTIDEYEWTEGTEILGMSETLEYEFDEGEHEVELQVTDNDGLSGTDTVVIDVLPAPEVGPMADAGQDQTVISGEMVELDGSGSSDENGFIVSYEWSLGMLDLGTDEIVMVDSLDLEVGANEITLLVTDDDELTDTATVTVTVTAAGETDDEDAPDASNIVDGGKTSATGEFVAPIRTLA